MNDWYSPLVWLHLGVALFWGIRLLRGWEQ